MKINEIFKSIQGEGTAAGLPCTFVRTTFCNLRCRWCDTGYAFYDGEEQSVEAILTTVNALSCRWVAITGGEPLLQDEVYPLMTRLLDGGYQVLVETSGSLPIDRVDPRAIIILDVKCPGSGMSHTIVWENLAKLKPTDEIKFVITDQNDFEWAKTVLKQNPTLNDKTVLFSPVFDKVEPCQLAEWILKENLPVRLNMQLHKFIWAPDRRGV
jgi:7-carboxy-7-deazaguanine synthase